MRKFRKLLELVGILGRSIEYITFDRMPVCKYCNVSYLIDLPFCKKCGGSIGLSMCKLVYDKYPDGSKVLYKATPLPDKIMPHPDDIESYQDNSL